MPEVCEIVMTSQYLMTKLKNRYITDINILSGRYTHENIVGKNLINKYAPLKIINVNSKGKFMWFELLNEKDNKYIYILNTFGLSGSWLFKDNPSNRIKFSIENKDKTKTYVLYFNDPRNFGTIKITDNIIDLNTKINKLSVDLLKTEFSDDEFLDWVNNFKSKDKEIIKILMTQEVNKGIGSGLGNYLAPEILYHAKISPFRTISSLNNNEIINLAQSIRYILKLCYTNNKIGYMEHFKNFIEKHKLGIKSGKYPQYHKKVHINDNIEFQFSVYQKKKILLVIMLLLII